MKVDPSFEAFVEARSAGLLRLAYLLTGDRGHAEDLLQTALLRAARRWRQASTPSVTGAPNELTGDLWVDPQTYLPVRFVMADRQILDYTWLPRTPQNLAVFDLRVPPGFTRVR